LAFGLNLGKLLGDSAAVTATLDCLLHHGRARVIRESAQHSTPSPLLIDGGERSASVSACDAHLCPVQRLHLLEKGAMELCDFTFNLDANPKKDMGQN